MKRKTHGQLQSLSAKDNKGIAMIIIVIIIAAIVSVIMIKTALNSITGLTVSDISLRDLEVQYFTEGCIQESLIQYHRDPSYTGGIFNISEGTCDVSVAGEGYDADLIITGSLNNYYRTLNINIASQSWDN